MKLLLAALLLMATYNTSAQAAAFAETSHNRHEVSAYGNLGFTRGGLNLGGDLEYNIEPVWSIGAYGRMYPEDSEVSGDLGILTFGGFARLHHFQREWDLYASVGAGILMVDNGNDDETGIGPSFGLGVLYQVTNQVAIGVEQMNHYAWFIDETLRGNLLNELSFKVHVGL